MARGRWIQDQSHLGLDRDGEGSRGVEDLLGSGEVGRTGVARRGREGQEFLRLEGRAKLDS